MNCEFRYSPAFLKAAKTLSKRYPSLKNDLEELRRSLSENPLQGIDLGGNNIVMLFNGFQKKTQKTPQNEIEKAIRLKNEYYAGK